MKRIDAHTLRHQFDALIAAYPEIAEDEILRADMFEAETELNGFMTLIVDRCEEAENVATRLTIKIDRLKERRRRFLNYVEATRGLMLKILQWADLKKIVLDEATISWRIGPGRVIITDEAAVPDAFCRIVRSPDLTKIREAFRNLEDVPGATLSNAEPMLTVRVK